MFILKHYQPGFRLQVEFVLLILWKNGVIREAASAITDVR